jgi:hypothetical protein
MKIYITIGFIFAAVTYAIEIMLGGVAGFLFGWAPALIVGALWPLVLAAVTVIGAIGGLIYMFAR